MHSAIMLTSTGSLLLSKAKLISADANQLISAPIIDNLSTLLQPDWNLCFDKVAKCVSKQNWKTCCQDLQESLCCTHDIVVAMQIMVEGANIQLVLQHMTLEKLNELLQLKENRKKDNCFTLFNRKGIVLTDEFEAEIKQQKEHREQQQAQKERNHQL